MSSDVPGGSYLFGDTGRGLEDLDEIESKWGILFAWRKVLTGIVRVRDG